MPARNYRQIATGQKVKGVTTILGGVLAKPALLWWAFKQGMSNFDRLMSIFAELGKTDSLKFVIHPIIQDFKVTSLYEKRDKAGDAGTLGHSFVEKHLRKLPEPSREGLPEEVIDKAEGCYLTFLDWEKANSIKIIDIEVELTSEEKPFGGTIDYVIQGALTPPNMVDILDIKTGKDIYLEAKIQVKSYGKLWEEHHPELPVAGFHILRLGENGEFTHKYFPNLDERYFKIFLNCLDTTELLSELGEKL